MASERPVQATTVTGEDVRPSGERAVLIAMAVALLLTVAYWVIWYGVDRDLLASSHAAAYYAFENAFPLADGWLVLALLLGIVNLARRRPAVVLWTLLAGGAGIYLGCMDVLFDLENGIYTSHPGADASASLIEIAINIITFTFGIAIIAWVWRHRAAYLATR
ncbi:MAG TPA: hypothetical protein VFU88_10950 [Ktedonobacterales bacterium]|nr:hypothetical protein [Ktedonobacterales bacterium]